jgi:uncharacterized protein
MSDDERPDWTAGTAAIVYQACPACDAVWYFRRDFCPTCGATSCQTLQSQGRGIVYAATLVCRAAAPEAKAHVPYRIVLVETDEGFRMMAHGSRDLAIGDRVVARWQRFTDHMVPYFTTDRDR